MTSLQRRSLWVREHCCLPASRLLLDVAVHDVIPRVIAAHPDQLAGAPLRAGVRGPVAIVRRMRV